MTTKKDLFKKHIEKLDNYNEFRQKSGTFGKPYISDDINSLIETIYDSSKNPVFELHQNKITFCSQVDLNKLKQKLIEYLE